MLRTVVLAIASAYALFATCMPAVGHWIECHKLTASDAAAGDQFGETVDVSGNTAIVGAPDDDDAGDSCGSAYVFDLATGKQRCKLAAADAAAGDWFGVSVGLGGNTAIVGACRDDDAGEGSGAAYLFDAVTGNQLRKLTARDAAAGDWFGVSVGISGNTAIVGAPNDDDAGGGCGSAYLFDLTNGNQLCKLTASDAAAGDWFGWSVAIGGSRAIVGAVGDDDAGGFSGSAYVFDTNTGNQLHKLTADDAAAGDWFGQSVAIDGDIAVVGADSDDDAGNASGSAYLFDVTTGNQLHKLTADDAAPRDGFGVAVDISGNTAIVGAHMDDVCCGSAYLFHATTGKQLRKLTASDSAREDKFGFSVGISGQRAVVGALWDDDGGGGSGSAYVFVPEPSALALLAAGILPFLACASRNRRQKRLPEAVRRPGR